MSGSVALGSADPANTTPPASLTAPRAPPESGVAVCHLMAPVWGSSADHDPPATDWLPLMVYGIPNTSDSAV